MRTGTAAAIFLPITAVALAGGALYGISRATRRHDEPAPTDATTKPSPAAVAPSGNSQRLIDEAAASADTDGLAPEGRISSDQAAALARRARTEISWTDDGECYYRAMEGASILYQEQGSVGAVDARSAAIAVIPGPIAGQPGWHFHAGLAYRDSEGEVRVLDRLSGAAAAPVDDWARGWGVDPEQVQYVSPLEDVNFSYEGSGTKRTASFVETDEDWPAEFFTEHVQ